MTKNANLPSRHTQRGASLVIAIFILVALSLLAAAMINILNTGADSVAREVLSTRALFAAESGAQWKLNAIFPPGSPTATANCNDDDPTLSGLTFCANAYIDVNCTFLPINGSNYFTITSMGLCGPTNEQAARVVEVKARDGL
ncbi:MAG: hypothetical protein JKY66_04150 [Spongiibacteraceae bacterium]|nr:hypothetical protein [Spongiibacteraceae bacterium]MBN4055473.1 hypothetical protein [bacterium AH-315-K03]